MIEIVREHWEPTVYDYSTIMKELLAEFPQNQLVNVISPGVNFQKHLSQAPATKWHRDNWVGTSNIDAVLYLYLWSNVLPTEIRKIGTEEIFIPKPFQIVKFDNELYEHRMSPITPKDRWFARIV